MIVKLIGWAASRPASMNVLRWWCQDREYGHLFNSENEIYMGRWSVIAKGSKASRVLSFLTGGRYDHVRLHWINCPDHDRELHDHPFNYRTFVLGGWYTEEYIPVSRGPLMNGPALREWQGSSRRLPWESLLGVSQRRMLKQGQSAAAPLGQFHRIARVSDGGVWTLFCMGEDHGQWGFLVDGRWMRSHKFFQLRRIDHDGRPVSA